MRNKIDHSRDATQFAKLMSPRLINKNRKLHTFANHDGHAKP